MPLLITSMSLGVLVLDLALVVCALGLLRASSRKQVIVLARQHGRMIIFLLSLLSIAGTVWMQYGDNLAPCVLCWWQRICMYPIALISGVAIVKNTDLGEIADYVLGLSFIGAVISLYQHLLQVLPAGSLIPCDASGDCAVRSVFEFGFVTIPWMALTVFATILFIALASRKNSG